MLIDIPKAFQDEFGEIDAEVWREAPNVWKYNQDVLRTLNDEQMGQDLLKKAAAKVSKKFKTEKILSLRWYLSKTFRRFVSAEVRERLRHQELDEKYVKNLDELFQKTGISEEEKIYREILIEEIESEMDKWTKDVFRYRMLGYNFKEIALHYDMAENHVRTKFGRELKKLAEVFQKK